MRPQVFIYSDTDIDKCVYASMISCNKCGRALVKPIRKLENSLFCIEVFKCRHCDATYKEAHYRNEIVFNGLSICLSAGQTESAKKKATKALA